MRRALAALFGALVLAGAQPANAVAATCSDYPNQAAAQRAHDTRDADGDGIYCESLPCPCLKPGQGGGSPKPHRRRRSAAPAVTCGKERWSVKTLQDERASRVHYTPKRTTVQDLRALEPPDVGRSTPRLEGEFTTYRINVRLRSFRLEDDSDVHLVVGALNSPSKTMIVEFPRSACLEKTGPKNRRRMVAARRALVRACGAPSSSRFKLLSGTASITGVAFFDVIHGQRGVAPNGIELYPVLSFRATSRCGGR